MCLVPIVFLSFCAVTCNNTVRADDDEEDAGSIDGGGSGGTGGYGGGGTGGISGKGGKGGSGGFSCVCKQRLLIVN